MRLSVRSDCCRAGGLNGQVVLAVYVSNLSWSTTRDLLCWHFGHFGAIKDVNLKPNKV